MLPRPSTNYRFALGHGIPDSTVRSSPPAWSESEVISRTYRPIPARPDGERNPSLGDAWAFRRQVAFPHASMACHPRGPGTYESASSPWLYQRGITSSSAYGRAGGRPLLSRGVGTASCRIGFSWGNCALRLFGFMEIGHARALCGRAWTQGAVSVFPSSSCSAAAAANVRLNCGLLLSVVLSIFWGACMRCGQRMTPSADSAGSIRVQGTKDPRHLWRSYLVAGEGPARLVAP